MEGGTVQASRWDASPSGLVPGDDSPGYFRTALAGLALTEESCFVVLKGSGLLAHHERQAESAQAEQDQRCSRRLGNGNERLTAVRVR